MRYLLIIIIFISGSALACDSIRISNGESDTARQKEILSPQNPHLRPVTKITNDLVKQKILLAVLASFKIPPESIDFSKSVYTSPLCMDDLDFMELVLESEDIFDIKVSDAEMESVFANGRASISLETLERVVRSKL